MLGSDIPGGAVVVAIGLVSAWLIHRALTGLFNLFFHSLSGFPGPRAAAFTAWYKTYQELFLGRSWIDVLQELHTKYGKEWMSLHGGDGKLANWQIRQDCPCWSQRGT